jgi:hypothetical protein
MKFTYVPQCPTSQPGSVMLVFERDPEAPAADTQSNSFMQEVMSYEHAVLTPAWVSTQVTYKRDPHEVKTWFMGGDQANLTARETSQGTFLAYTSNAAVQTSPGAAGKLGFIVMDFALDLISPNILPNRTLNQGIQQYSQCTNLGLRNISSATMQLGEFQQQFFVDGLTSPSAFTITPGTIFEVIIDGATGSTANNGQSITAFLNSFVYGTGGLVAFTPVLSSGSRFYLTAVQTFNQSAVAYGGTAGGTIVFLAAATLADAIANCSPANNVLSTSMADSARTYQLMSSALACSAQSATVGWGANNVISQQNAFVRVLVAPANRNTA